MKKTGIVAGIAVISIIMALCMENMDNHRVERVETENPEYRLERELPQKTLGLHNITISEYSLPDKNAEPLTVCEDIGIKADSDKEYTDSIKQVISDYLHMDSLEFQEKYKEEELYKKGILYCDKNAWKYDGSQLDAFQDKYYNVENITAIRINEKQSSPIYHNLNIGDETDQYEEKVNINYNTNYAVSIYGKLSDDNISLIEEISFLKIELDKGTAPKELYRFIESNYYEVMENLEHQTWISSPDGEKVACVSNGDLPKHPAQIFIWYQDDKPYTIFRRTWEHEIVGWIDDNHLICYAIDVGMPVLIHLERNEIEAISNEKSDYDTYGAEYTIQENYLIAQDFEKQLYQWKILEKDGEIFVLDTYTKEGELLFEANLAAKELEWNWVVKPEEYEKCFYLGEELIAVKKENGYYGVIDKSGEFAFSEEYEELGAYYEGIARVRKNGAAFFVDRKGKRISAMSFTDAHDFHERKAAVMFYNDLWGVMNRKGEIIIEGQWDNMNNFSEGLAAVQTGDKWGFINVTGEMIIPCHYDAVRDFQEGYAAVRQGNQWGFVDRFGKKIIAYQYDEVRDFQEGYAAVRRENQWGFINREGELCIVCQYDEASSFSEGKAAVKRNHFLNGYMDAWAYIDQNNSVVIDYYAYTALEGRMEYAGEFQDGIAFVSDGFYSIIDAEGNRIYDGQDSRFFISALKYNKEFDAIPVYIYADDAMTIKKYGLAGLNGKQRLAPEFDYVHGIFDHYVLISQKVDGEWRYGVIEITENTQTNAQE